MGSEGGNVGLVQNSCISNGTGEFEACIRVADEGGSVGQIINSCEGKGACNTVASNGGSVDKVVDSCKDRFSCLAMGSDFGDIGPVERSCLADDSCANVATTSGNVGFLNESCLSSNSCKEMATSGGTVLGVAQSCNGDFAAPCNSLGRNGTVGPVAYSCNNQGACQNLALDGAVGPLSHSCNSDYGCVRMANAGSVGPVAFSCNGGEDACIYVQCKADFGPCSPDSNATGIEYINGSCNFAEICSQYMGDTDGSGLTCTEKPPNHFSSPVIFSPPGITCVDSDGGIGMCDGSGPFCTTAPSAMPSKSPAPSAMPSKSPESIYIVHSAITEPITKNTIIYVRFYCLIHKSPV